MKLHKNHIKDAIAGASLAVIILTPATKGIFGLENNLYLIAAGMLIIASLCSINYWKFDTNRLVWALLLTAIFGFLLITSLVAGILDIDNALIFLVGTLTLGILPILGWQRSFFMSFIYVMIAGSLLTTAIILNGYILGSGDFRAGIDFEGYLTAGKIIAIGLVITLPLMFAEPGLMKGIWLCVLLAMILGLIAVLARGALLYATTITVITLVIYWPRYSTNLGSLAVNVVLRTSMLIFLLAALLLLPERTEERLSRIWSGEEFTNSVRISLWETAVHRISESPFVGNGIGTSLIPIYPHNMFLQIGIDGGIMAIILLLCIVIWPLLIAWRAISYKSAAAASPVTIGLSFVYIYLCLEYSKSGDFYKARDLFITGAMLIGFVSYETKFKMNSLSGIDYRL
jgi:O-antigen ligase